MQLARQLDAVAASQAVSQADLILSMIVIVASTGGLHAHVGHDAVSVPGDHQAPQVHLLPL